MNKDEALKLALEALEYAQYADEFAIERGDKAITAIKQALAAPVQEPVGVCGNPRNACGLPCEPCEGKPDPEWITTRAAQPAPVQEPVAAPVQNVDWKDMYEKEKHRSEMWVAKYEKDIGPLEKAVPVAAPVQEPIYQCQLANGSWIDQTKESYDYNVRHGQATVRIVYTTPPAAPVQEPVGYWLIGTDHVEFDKHEYHNGPEWEAIYTTPPAAQRKWVGLEPEEIAEILSVHYMYMSDLARAIETKLKEKNT